MAKFKQSQILPGVTNHRTQALLVHCADDLKEGDILYAAGVHDGTHLSVGRADAASGSGELKRSGPLWVADYDAAAGDITPVAVPMKIMSVPTPSTGEVAIGDSIFLKNGGVSGATTDRSAGTGTYRVGRYLATRGGSPDTSSVLGILWPSGHDDAS